jgi:hypothetical protein
MPLKSGRMTRRELSFVEQMARHNDSTVAAKRAGYAQPEIAGGVIMSKPAMQAAVKERERSVLITELLPLANKALRDVLMLEGAGVPWGAKMKAVDIIHKHAYSEQEGGSGKAPSEMTPDELGAALDRLKSELAERARPPVLELEPEQEDIPKQDVFG